jgi:restriction system protein
MAIPFAEDLMLPLLQYAGDAQEHSSKDAIETLARLFKLSDEERRTFRPDGRTPVFNNRVGWARMYLYKSGLVSSERRGFFRITERGIDVLRQAPARLTQRFLLQFPEYAEYRRAKPPKGAPDAGQPQVEGPDVPSKVLSFTDAAEQVLEQYGRKEPMHYRAITAKVLELGLVRTQGQTPQATLYAQILTEIDRRTRQGNSPRFTRHGKGLIGLSRWTGSGLGAQIDQHNREARALLLSRLGTMSPTGFEELIGQLLVALGFQDVAVTSRSGDGGIDVRGILVVGDVIRTRMAVQVKRWRANVQAPVVQQVRGSLGTHDQGLIITTSDFSVGARAEAERANAVPVALMNGEQLVRLLVEHNIGVRRTSYDLIELEGDQTE